jgi:radical SAM protein with 4Fe4S-binding SPASM domain
MLKHVQIDTTGWCGSKCWFCPVRYFDRPNAPFVHMLPLDVFENILNQLVNLKETGIADRNLTLWLSAYGDPLADTYLDFRLRQVGEHGFLIPIVTNGVYLEKNVDTIIRRNNCIGNFSINIPAGNRDDYFKYTLNDPSVFDSIIRGITGLIDADETFKTRIHVNVNGAYTHDENGRCQLLYPLPDGDTDKQVQQLKELLPDVTVHDARPLCDRAGLLATVAINNSAMPNRLNWRLPVGATTATGCNGGDRLDSWLHITNAGKVIACCQDYQEVSVFGDIEKQTLLEIWNSDERQRMKETMLSGLCVKCHFSY